MNDESEGEKAVKYNGRVYHDIATVKESENDNSLGRKTVWHITAEETVYFKISKFFMAKSNMPKDMCAFMQQEKSRGHPILIIRQGNAGENKSWSRWLIRKNGSLTLFLRTLLAKHPSKILMRNLLSR